MTPIFNGLVTSVAAIFILVLMFVLLLAVFMSDVMLGALVIWVLATVAASWWIASRRQRYPSL